ncbi:MAG TPA: alkaline phosphatase D family protein [Methylomirabilota bacterium]|jgi:alkaline phosphatase D|nr:alkaline phosphatase D family protein [Methylomirabilota bacterium]
MMAPLCLVLLLLVASVAGAAEPTPLVTVGEVTGSAAVLWMRGHSPGVLVVRHAAVSEAPPREVEVRVSPATDLVAKLALEGLTPATRYRYAVNQGGVEVQGEFVTAPAAASPLPVRFVWSGDLGSRTMCRHLSDGYPMFRTLGRFKVDFFLFLGDTIYGDHPCGGPDRVPGYDFVARTVPEFRAKHRYNREDPDVQAYFRSLSVYAIWDDHEVRNDFSGPTDPLMPAGRQAFIEYFPIQPPSEEPTRLYRKFRWGSLLELFILDTRQYRRPNAELDGPAKTMLGAAQRRWLIESVSGSSARWKVVATSVPLSVPTGGKIHDSWSNANALGFPEANGTGFAMERDAILQALRERGVKNLVFLTGDVHHAELIRHHPTPEWSFHEFIAGPLSASYGRPRPLDMGLNPRSLFALGGVENFGEVSVDQAGLTVRVVDIGGTVRFTHTIGAER